MVKVPSSTRVLLGVPSAQHSARVRGLGTAVGVPRRKSSSKLTPWNLAPSPAHFEGGENCLRRPLDAKKRLKHRWSVKHCFRTNNA